MPSYYELPEYSAILTFVDAVFSQINIGLLIYHLEEPDDPTKLRLIYANAEASRCTGTDLSDRIGKFILEAFPNLQETDLPRIYASVAIKEIPQRLGVVSYKDDQLQEASYAVRAFPMPSSCVGILFENVRGTSPLID
jgi:hypothetical protein